MSNEKKVAVTFKKPWRGYNKGEVAGFDADTVEVLVGAGLVEESQAKGRRAAAPKNVEQSKPSPVADGADKAPAAGQLNGPDADNERP